MYGPNTNTHIPGYAKTMIYKGIRYRWKQRHSTLGSSIARFVWDSLIVGGLNLSLSPGSIGHHNMPYATSTSTSQAK
jgi:hypothetical protein